MAKLIVDHTEFDVQEGKNLLEVCLSLGYDVPYFCWHPALGSVGSCRQCAVKQFKDENDTEGKLVMSCMEPVTDGMIISITDPEAEEFRKAIIEWLMVNHPHDCPVCDEGGECHLQDMTVMTGHACRRYRFGKRTYRNQYLGPFINHEMNRCIQCYRCVRFYRDHAGGRDFSVFSKGDSVYFGRYEEGVLENEFSGNLVEVCPTGVFTDKTLKKHYTRKWDLTHAPSICAHCSVGCNTVAGERYGTLRRIQSRYNGEVNGYFICDRGRFGYEFVNDTERITSVLIDGRIAAGQSEERQSQGENDADATSHGQARQSEGGSGRSVEEVVRLTDEALRGRVVGIGSPRASLESNYMLSRLVGNGQFYAGENKGNYSLNRKILKILKEGAVRTPSLKEMEEADAVLVLGEDLTNTAPMMALALRQAARTRPMKKAEALKIPEWHDSAVRELLQGEKGPLFLATSYPTKLKDIAGMNHIATPGDLADFGMTIARMIDETAPDPAGELEEEIRKLAKVVAGELKRAEKPLIVSGAGCLNGAVIDAAYNISRALRSNTGNRVRLAFALNEFNSMGLAMMADRDLDDLAAEEEKIDTLIVLENDLYRRMTGAKVEAILGKSGKVIVLDHLMNSTASAADVVIPAGTFAESQGTCVNNEGRAQRFFRVHEPEGAVRDSWKWLKLMMNERKGSGIPLDNSYDGIVAAIAGSDPMFRGIDTLSPPSGYRASGQKIPRQSERYSGRTAMHAGRNVREPRPPVDDNSPLSYSMEGYLGIPPSSVIPFFWSPGWNSVQAINKYQIETDGPLHGGDPGLRLLEPQEGEGLDYVQGNREVNGASDDRLLMVPGHHIFGSEELSARSPSIARLSPEPYAAIGPETAGRLGITEQDTVLLPGAEKEHKLSVKITEEIPSHIVVVPAGLPGFLPDFLHPLVRIKKDKA